jgi:hypothetical protein
MESTGTYDVSIDVRTDMMTFDAFENCAVNNTVINNTVISTNLILRFDSIFLFIFVSANID